MKISKVLYSKFKVILDKLEKQLNFNVLTLVLQILLLVIMFKIERYYDKQNLWNSQMSNLVYLNSEIIGKCQTAIKPCDEEFKRSLKMFRAKYNSLAYFIDRDKKISSDLAVIDNNIENIITYDYCECDELAKNLMRFNNNIFKNYP